ncbi:LacI family DNA-binding transcriptional regulator [Nocardioides mesophilus]|uniref:LacI family DNA-binding transcriptional regulator n=1 Tax=Nocardioides mesophilus TaxID=433659 RepID=A0A7G9RG45_9ACTN|nr:LacI family DNA-binding transcriptional regulator [Nocardioides mesophilus]QNN54570.1 LacI family DNA-binding transcriptional regulator [Nocardioides mesophilus]
MSAPEGGPTTPDEQAPRKRRGPRPSTTTSWTVAHEVGVSQSTVSRALRKDPRVRPETRRRIEEAAERLGYRPLNGDDAATSHRTIGVVVADLTNPFFPSLLTPIHDELRLMGYRVVLFAERTDIPTGQEALNRLLDRSIDGVLVTTATLGSRFPDAVRERDLPIVLLNRYVDGMDVDRVVADNHEGGRLAGRHLVELGHERIGVIRGPSNTSTSRDRLAGLVEVLGEAGIELDESLMRKGPYSHQNGYQHARELLRLKEPPTALFCANDVIGFGAVDAARSLGVDVPSQVSIIGFDDVPMAAWEVFQLTTVRQPLGDMARAAARMLAERIEFDGEIGPGREQVFATSLVKRSTTDRAAATPPAGA